MKINIIAVLAVILLLVYGCSSSDACKKGTAEEALARTAAEKFGSDYQLSESPGEKYVLCVKRTEKGKIPGPAPLAYFVFEKETETILFEEQLNRGTVKWFDDYHVQISAQPGAITTDEEKNKELKGYKIDVRTGKKVR